MKRGNLINLQVLVWGANEAFYKMVDNPDDDTLYNEYKQAWERLLFYVNTHISDGSVEYERLAKIVTH